MLIVKGNKQLELNKEEYLEIVSRHEKVVLDMGTGDGRYVFKKAMENPNVLYLGIDPSAKQLKIYSKKALRKNLQNALFIISSIELLPEELVRSVDEILIILPWGTLLQYLVSAKDSDLKKLTRLYRGAGSLHLILGYSLESEPSETERLELPKISKEFLKEELITKYQSNGFKLRYLVELKKGEAGAMVER